MYRNDAGPDDRRSTRYRSKPQPYGARGPGRNLLVIDPEIPADEQQLLRDTNPDLLVRADQEPPARRRVRLERTGRCPHPHRCPPSTLAVLLPLAVISAAGFLRDWLPTVLPAVSVDQVATPVEAISSGLGMFLKGLLMGIQWLACMIGIIAMVVPRRCPGELRIRLRETPHERAARQHHGSYLTGHDLDEPARDLLRRAVTAVDLVRTSRVCQDGVLDLAAQELVLSHLLWDLAKTLHRQTRLRAQHHHLTTGTGAFARFTERVLSPQAMVMRFLAKAAQRRVKALETYARRVDIAEARYEEWRRVGRLAELNDDLLTELAHALTDRQSVLGLGSLSEQVEASLRLLRRAVAEAHASLTPCSVLLSPPASPSAGG